MIRRLLAVLFVVLCAVALSANGAIAADQPSNITGLFLTTKYPGADRASRRDHDRRPGIAQFQIAAAIPHSVACRKSQMAGRRRSSAAASP